MGSSCISFETVERATGTWWVTNKKTGLSLEYHWNPHDYKPPSRGLSNEGIKNHEDMYNEYKENYDVTEVFIKYNYCHSIKRKI